MLGNAIHNIVEYKLQKYEISNFYHDGIFMIVYYYIHRL
jgi:hypothetical protein